MPSDDFGPRARPARPDPGALLLCRADPGDVAPTARLLRDRVLLTSAGPRWSVLVPAGRPWRREGEPVDRVATGWATALAVGAPWPVLALWWDADRAGYTLASGYRRPVGYIWLTDGTPVGEEEAMRTFAARLGLDPAADLPLLEALTRSGPGFGPGPGPGPGFGVDARARLDGLLAVLVRAGVDLPPGLTPGESVDRLREAARSRPGVQEIREPGRAGSPRPASTLTDPGPGSPGTAGRGDERGLPGPLLPYAGSPGARVLALAQVAAGLPLTAWGLRRRDGGWIASGTLLMAHGALGLLYDLGRPRD
ncbi:hypothetical protein ACFC00_41815 [Streptomyces adustus]|uniref:hypothetical protein n=1 Tax=Streptomyces adustus TaxID=1609272 RepID=UPI0035D83A3F